MKVRKMFGLTVCAAVSVVAFNAMANTTTNWFGASVSGSALTLTAVTTNGVDVTVADGKITLDNDSSSPLVFTPSVSAPATSDGVVKISASAVLTPSSTNSFAVTEGAKAGFAVGVDDSNNTNYYGFANGAWTKLAGSNPPAEGVETSFGLVMDYRTGKRNVQFYVGDTLLSAAVGGATSFPIASGTDNLVAIDAFGSGSISSISSGCEVAVASYGDVKYGSVAEAIAAAGSEHKADVKPVDGSGNVPASATAANGLPAVVCSVLGIAANDVSAQVKATPVDNDVDQSYITLAIPVSEPGVVKFTVSDGKTSDEYTNASAIKIPLTTGVYTITPALQ